jgi:hypothetical protein
LKTPDKFGDQPIQINRQGQADQIDLEMEENLEWIEEQLARMIEEPMINESLKAIVEDYKL